MDMKMHYGALIAIFVIIVAAVLLSNMHWITGRGAGTTTTIPEPTMPQTTIPETTLPATIPEPTTIRETTIPAAAECRSDSDCAVGGNFNQSCLPGGSEFTDGEWKPEYLCLIETGCSCIMGECDWDETYEYKECIARLSINYCREDTDCIPEQCCHPTSCIGSEFGRDCPGVACTEECRQGTMDCGCGRCACIEHECTVVWRNVKNCDSVVEL